jgi:hypothetical protein
MSGMLLPGTGRGTVRSMAEGALRMLPDWTRGPRRQPSADPPPRHGED